MTFVIRNKTTGRYAAPFGWPMPTVETTGMARRWESEEAARLCCCAHEEVVPLNIRIKIVRRRESITADEILKKLAATNQGDQFTAEKTFAIGLIEAAIGEITNG